MNTTAAALQANVTTATIRAWCRTGVITAVKAAGRWAIEAASLAHRIAIAAMRTRKATRVNLNATYTYTPAGETRPGTISPRIKTRTTRSGITLTSIDRIAPLLADRIDAIEDEGDRLHTLTVLEGARIVIADQPRPGFDPATVRDEGRLATTYRGTRDLPISVVLDLAEQIRTAL
ncbi:hypothetical protein [Streptomyces sp.]|uniref:hypothetical protein n=1 Tax=Streptomyces sp. TaxID=1931 RepID=UPI002F405D2A